MIFRNTVNFDMENLKLMTKILGFQLDKKDFLKYI
jgi:hypothetical protein